MIIEVIIVIFILLHINAFVRTVAYKLAYKDKAVVLFFPFLGMIAYQLYGYIRYKDVYYYHKQIVKKNPKAKILIGNFLLDFVIYFIDPACIKEVS